MTIHLESYSLPKSPKQAVDLHDLVENEQQWLGDIFPDTTERYSGLMQAFKSVVRIAMSKEVHAYIIRPGRYLNAAIGVATVIPDQAVLHPDEGRIGGDDIDY